MVANNLDRCTRQHGKHAISRSPVVLACQQVNSPRLATCGRNVEAVADWAVASESAPSLATICLEYRRLRHVNHEIPPKRVFSKCLHEATFLVTIHRIGLKLSKSVKILVQAI